jgi:hypothetical protein
VIPVKVADAYRLFRIKQTGENFSANTKNILSFSGTLLALIGLTLVGFEVYGTLIAKA